MNTQKYFMMGQKKHSHSSHFIFIFKLKYPTIFLQGLWLTIYLPGTYEYNKNQGQGFSSTVDPKVFTKQIQIFQTLDKKWKVNSKIQTNSFLPQKQVFRAFSIGVRIPLHWIKKKIPWKLLNLLNCLFLLQIIWKAEMQFSVHNMRI